jgi:hypothetical protein
VGSVVLGVGAKLLVCVPDVVEVQGGGGVEVTHCIGACMAGHHAYRVGLADWCVLAWTTHDCPSARAIAPRCHALSCCLYLLLTILLLLSLLLLLPPTGGAVSLWVQ